MEIRSLRAGEERMWVACGSSGAADMDEKVTRFLEHRTRYPEDPICFIVALDGDRCVGKLRGLIVHRELYVINNLIVEPLENHEDIGHSLIDYTMKGNANRRVEAVTWIKPENEHFDRSLRVYGFSVFIEKVLVRRSLTDYCNPYDDPLSWKTFVEAGRDAFVTVLGRIHAANPNRDAHQGDPAEDLDESIDEAGIAFDGSLWKLAYYRRDLIGVILPQIYPDSPGEGTILNMGLVPEFRGRGWGKIIHAKGLESLARVGGKDYIGSTDILNEPMVRVFETNGCPVKGIRRIYRL